MEARRLLGRPLGPVDLFGEGNRSVVNLDIWGKMVSFFTLPVWVPFHFETYNSSCRRETHLVFSVLSRVRPCPSVSTHMYLDVKPSLGAWFIGECVLGVHNSNMNTLAQAKRRRIYHRRTTLNASSMTDTGGITRDSFFRRTSRLSQSMKVPVALSTNWFANNNKWMKAILDEQNHYPACRTKGHVQRSITTSVYQPLYIRTASVHLTHVLVQCSLAIHIRQSIMSRFSSSLSHFLSLFLFFPS